MPHPSQVFVQFPSLPRKYLSCESSTFLPFSLTQSYFSDIPSTTAQIVFIKAINDLQFTVSTPGYIGEYFLLGVVLASEVKNLQGSGKQDKHHVAQRVNSAEVKTLLST